MTLHDLLDWTYGEDGIRRLRAALGDGDDPNGREGEFGETPLHVAARRRRCDAIAVLLDHGAAIDARTRGGQTAYAHALRRGFDDVAELLEARGADTALGGADRVAVALAHGRLDEARALLRSHPGVACTGVPEQDRLLADMAGRDDPEPVRILIDAGADLRATGLDGGTALHQAAWFGQPRNAELLLEAGAPVDVFDPVHESSPLGWAVHGSRYSGGADERQDVYVALTRLLLDAGSSLRYPGDDGGAYLERLRSDATPGVLALLPESADGSMP